jgi:hypothetical protein
MTPSQTRFPLALFAVFAALSAAACGGDSPTEERPAAQITASAVARPDLDRYLFIRDTVRHGCGYRPVVTNQGPRAVTLDSIIFTSPTVTSATTAAELGLPAVLGVGGEASPTNRFYNVLAPGPARLRVVFNDEGRRGTAEADAPCTGKVSPVATGRSGALTIELVAGSTALYRIRNTTAAPVEWVGLQTTVGTSSSWQGQKPGTMIAAGDTLRYSVTGATVDGIGYFVGDLFGSTRR